MVEVEVEVVTGVGTEMRIEIVDLIEVVKGIEVLAVFVFVVEVFEVDVGGDGTEVDL